MVDARIELITAQIIFRQELDDAFFKKFEALDKADREEMEIRELDKERQIRGAQIRIEQNTLVFEQYIIEWYDACERLKKLEEREGRSGVQQG